MLYPKMSDDHNRIMSDIRVAIRKALNEHSPAIIMPERIIARRDNLGVYAAANGIRRVRSICEAAPRPQQS